MQRLTQWIMQRPTAFFIVALALLLLIAYAPQLAGVASIQWDAVSVHTANMMYASDEIHAGRWPLWTPFIGAGFPFFADPQSAIWYPVNLLIVLFTNAGARWTSVALMFHAFLAGLGMYLLTRRLFETRLAPVFVGLIYPFTGFFIGYASHVGQQHMAALVPWAVLALDRLIDAPSVRRSSMLGLVGGLLLLVGHFQQALFAAIFLLAWLLWRAWWQGRATNPRSLGIALVGAFFLASLIAAVQILPTAELLAYTARGAWSPEFIATNPLEPQTLLSLFIPNMQGAVSGGPYWGIWDVTQNNLFIGMLPILLALLAITRMRGIPKIFFIGVATASFLYALGIGGSLFQAVSLLPLFDKMRSAIHASLYITVALVILAGYGLEGVLSGAIREGISPWLRRGVPIVLLLTLAVSLAVLLIARTALPETAQFASLSLATKTWANTFIMSVVLFLIADALIRAFIAEPGTRMRMIVLTFVMIELMTMAMASRTFATWRSPQGVLAAPSWTKTLLEQQTPAGADRAWGLSALAMNHSQAIRNPSFDLYNPLELERFVEYRKMLRTSDALRSRAGIRWVPCADRPAQPCEAKDARPLVEFAPARPVENPTGALRIAARTTTQEVMVEDLTEPIPAPTATRFAVMHRSTQSITLATETPHTSFLTFRETWYPGWRATIDGVRAPIYRTDYLFQGIIVPPGSHTITWTFAPRTFWYGLALTLLGLLGIAICFLFQPLQMMLNKP